MLHAIIWMAGLMTAGAAGENLLANPGFEERSGERPAAWNLYVGPHENAYGRLDKTAAEGQYSALLDTPTPYPKDPFNNWSQNVIAELEGKRLRATGRIRVENAGEAALWIQCWRKQPWGVIGASSSSTESKLSGTSDWQEVSTEMEVPEGTHFVTLRCVLLGAGKAWFDDVSLTGVEAGATPQVAPTPPGAVKENTPPSPPPAPVASAPPPQEQAPLPAPEELPDLGRIEEDIAEARELSWALVDELGRMRDANESLRQELDTLRTELDRLHGEPATQALPEATPPPLVPHGMDWRTLR